MCFFFLAQEKKNVLYIGDFEVYIYQIMGIWVSNYMYVINSSWLEMHAQVIKFGIMGKKNKKWNCREFWLTKKQNENMAMNSLSEPMRKNSLCHDKRNHRGTQCLLAQRNLATGRR